MYTKTNLFSIRNTPMNRYMQTRFLGSGTYARVYAAVDTITNTLVALKKSTIVSREGIPATSLREIALLRSMQHPNIVCLLDVVPSPRNLVLVFEYIEYDLKAYTKAFRFDLPFMTLQLCKGLEYMHEKRIVHRDLKLQNILVTKNGILKIADFGLARTLTIRTILHSEVVTLWYRSPELLENHQDYDCYIDIWSLGCIICEMKTNNPLFPGNNEKEQLKLVMNAYRYGMGRFIDENVGKLPDFIADIVLNSLLVDFTRRITARQCVKILEIAMNL